MDAPRGDEAGWKERARRARLEADLFAANPFEANLFFMVDIPINV
jgi:hypothetical protein